MDDIEKPHHHDVLCGRGVTTNRHPGNESFRSLVSLNKVSQCSSRTMIPYSFFYCEKINSSCKRGGIFIFHMIVNSLNLVELPETRL